MSTVSNTDQKKMETLVVSLMQQTAVSQHVYIFTLSHAQYDSFVFVKVYSYVSLTLTSNDMFKDRNYQLFITVIKSVLNPDR